MSDMSDVPVETSSIPDFGPLKQKGSHQLLAITLSAFFMSFLILELIEQRSVPSDFIIFGGLSFILSLLLLNAAFTTRVIAGGCFLISSPLHKRRVPFEEIISVGKREINVKNGHVEAIQFFTMDHKDIIILKTSLSESSYHALYKWAMRYFPET